MVEDEVVVVTDISAVQLAIAVADGFLLVVFKLLVVGTVVVEV